MLFAIEKPLAQDGRSRLVKREFCYWAENTGKCDDN
jgi:hypothetical protein